MDSLIKFLKIILLIIAILIGLAVLGGIYFVVQGLRSGDLGAYLQKTAVEAVLEEDSLTPYQQEMLDSGNIEALVTDLSENVTQEQIDCAVQVVGAQRAQELMITQDPTPQEMLKLSKCL